MHFSRLSVVSSLLAAASAAPSSFRSGPDSKAARAAACADVSGTFEIENYRLYSENLDWDPVHCKLYISANFNATVMVYDPYEKTYDILEFDGISHVDPFHVSGIDYDASSGAIMISANSGNPFVSSGADMTGANYYIKYDTNTNSVAYTADMSTFTDQLQINNQTGGGFQDSAEDAQGNTYVPTVFHVPSIAKISKTGEVSAWYVGEPTSSSSYTYLGLVHNTNFTKLVVTSPYQALFQTFDLTSDAPTPTNVTMNGRPADGSYPGLECDGLINPTRYSGNVLLCSENGLAAITLWATTDDFASVNYIGQVADNSTADIVAWGSPTATVELESSIFISHEYFHDLNEFDVVGNRTTFPFVDITTQVDALVTAAGLTVTTA